MKISRKARGWVQIRVSGIQQGRFLSVLLARGILYENAAYEEGILYLEMPSRQFREAVLCAKKTGVRLRIVSKRGLPFLFFRHRRRKWTLLFVLPMMMIVFILPHFVWTIEVDGLEKISQVEMLSRLEQLKVVKGIRQSELELEQIKDQLLLQYEDLSFVSLTLEGTTLRVLIEETLDAPKMVERDEPCDLVSKDNCVIYSAVTESGTPVVQAGDVVQKGDIMILGEVILKDDAGNETIVPTHASGEIYGKIMWRGETEIEKQYKSQFFSGKVQRGLGIRFGKKKIELRWPFEKKEREVVIEEELWKVPLGDFLSFQKLTYESYEFRQEEYSDEEMEARLRERLERQLGEELAQGDRILLEQEWQFQKTMQGMKAVLEAEMMENIGQKAARRAEVIEE